MRRAASLTLSIGIALSWALPAAADGSEGVELIIEPESAEVRLGETIEIDVRVDNPTDQPTASLVVHIDMTDPNLAGSIDPEDWTETLSRGVGIIEPGGSAHASWSVQPISGGEFSLYAVALSAGSSQLAVSPAMLITVDERRSLNPEGILPVAIAAPAVVGGLLVVQQRVARRNRAPSERSSETPSGGSST